MVPAAATAAVVPTERNRLRIGAPIRVVASAYSARAAPPAKCLAKYALLETLVPRAGDSRSAEVRERCPRTRCRSPRRRRCKAVSCRHQFVKLSGSRR